MPFYGLVRAFAWSLVAGHYRRHHVGGQVPADGALVVICNHNNGLVDGVIQFEITDRKLRILAKYKLFETFGIAPMVRALGAIPVYRQKDGVDTSKNISAFQAIGEALREGGAIMLFPEGESTYHHRVRPFHTGVARMALGAEDPTDFTCGVQILPVGLAYDNPLAYRSHAWIWVGEPCMCTDLRELYQSDGRKAVRVFLQRIVEAQRAVTVELDEAGDHRPVCVAEQIARPDDRHVPQRRQALAAGLGRLRAVDAAAASALIGRLNGVGDRIDRHGLLPSDLAEDAPAPNAGSALIRALAGLLILALLIPVSLLVGPPFLLGRFFSRRSSAPQDKEVTITVLLTSVILPLWSVVWALVVGFQAGTMAALGTLAIIGLAFALMPRLWERRRTLQRALAHLTASSNLDPIRAECDTLRESLADLPQEG